MVCLQQDIGVQLHIRSNAIRPGTGQDGNRRKTLLWWYQRIADALDPVSLPSVRYAAGRRNHETKIRESEESGDEREQVRGSYPA
jgi:hypothetical protein